MGEAMGHNQMFNFQYCDSQFSSLASYSVKTDARKFPRYVNFVDFTVTYGYSKNLIRESLLVCNN